MSISKPQLPPALVKAIDSLPTASALILIGLLTEHCLRLSMIPSISPITATPAITKGNNENP